MCNENREKDKKCICEILRVIHILQQNSSGNPACLETCDSPVLNCSKPSICQCNTRPVTLYNCNGMLWTFPISRTGVCGETTSIFRVEKIDDCCATFRCLVEKEDDGKECFKATDTFFTLDLNCVCAIKCLRDTFIDCL